MDRKSIVLAWKKDHAPKIEQRSLSVRILPGYRLDFGDREQLQLNFEGIEVRENNPKLAVLYRRFI